MPRYDNFFLYFTTTDLGQQLRKKPFFKTFQREHRDLEGRLTNGIMSLGTLDMSELLRPFDGDLYEAYKIMKNCGASDKDLIGA